MAPLIAGLIVVAALVFGIPLFLASLRTDAMNQAASALSFSFGATGDKQYAIDLMDESIFRCTDDDYVMSPKNLISGVSEDFEIRLLDYRYRSMSGKSTWSRTVLRIDLNRTDLPVFSIHPCFLGFTLPNFLQGSRKVIPVGEPAGFSTWHCLRTGDDEETVRQMVPMDFLKFFVDNRKFRAECLGDRLLIHCGEWRMPARDLTQWVKHGVVLAGYLQGKVDRPVGKQARPADAVVDVSKLFSAEDDDRNEDGDRLKLDQ